MKPTTTPCNVLTSRHTVESNDRAFIDVAVISRQTFPLNSTAGFTLWLHRWPVVRFVAGMMPDWLCDVSWYPIRGPNERSQMAEYGETNSGRGRFCLYILHTNRIRACNAVACNLRLIDVTSSFVLYLCIFIHIYNMMCAHIIVQYALALVVFALAARYRFLYRACCWKSGSKPIDLYFHLFCIRIRTHRPHSILFRCYFCSLWLHVFIKFNCGHVSVVSIRSFNRSERTWIERISVSVFFSHGRAYQTGREPEIDASIYYISEEVVRLSLAFMSHRRP